MINFISVAAAVDNDIAITTVDSLNSIKSYDLLIYYLNYQSNLVDFVVARIIIIVIIAIIKVAAVADCSIIKLLIFFLFFLV